MTPNELKYSVMKEIDLFAQDGGKFILSPKLMKNIPFFYSWAPIPLVGYHDTGLVSNYYEWKIKDKKIFPLYLRSNNAEMVDGDHLTKVWNVSIDFLKVFSSGLQLLSYPIINNNMYGWWIQGLNIASYIKRNELEY